MTNRYPDADIWGLLLKARSLELFVARTDEERALLAEIEVRFGGSGSSSWRAKPVGELVRLTDNEFDIVRSTITAQVAQLKEAYLRGMAQARTDEQLEVVAGLQQLIGPPRDG